MRLDPGPYSASQLQETADKRNVPKRDKLLAKLKSKARKGKYHTIVMHWSMNDRIANELRHAGFSVRQVYTLFWVSHYEISWEEADDEDNGE
jgi:inosine/xanthosine triphosphate pyrophosphatase family protein